MGSADVASRTGQCGVGSVGEVLVKPGAWSGRTDASTGLNHRSVMPVRSDLGLVRTAHPHAACVVLCGFV